MTPNARFLSDRQICELLDEGRSTLYRSRKDGVFVQSVKIGPRATRTPDYEVAAIMQARIAGKTDEEIRNLVVELMAARRSAA
ncbi:MAG: transcriptional regulator [Gammaproteobacteria bacterium]|nr:transcriptional regulator [Gammaproteobacteria bacterium]